MEAGTTRTRCRGDSFVNNPHNSMLAIIAAILIVFWLLGFTLHVAGSLIHLILVVALVILVLHFLRGNKAV